MMIVRHIALLCTALGASACATMNPYVQHNRDVSEDNITACSLRPRPHGSAGGDTTKHGALGYACSMSIRLEKARSEIITTRSSLTAAIFPLAGIIGYNSARGINAPTNTAMTAGGFAGYSAVTTLAQTDRIRVYDSGLKSIQCAIGAYEVEIARPSTHAMEATSVLLEADRVDKLLASALQSVGSNSTAGQEISRMRTLVHAIHQSATKHDPDAHKGARLIQFVRNTVTKVNAQLTLTTPDNRQLVGDALGALQMPKGISTGEPPSPKLSDTARGQIHRMNLMNAKKPGVAAIDPGTLDNAVDGLLGRHRELIAAATEQTNGPDFSACAYADVGDTGFKGTIPPLRIGANDMYSGATVDLAAGATFTAVVSGGVPPYTATIAKTSNKDTITAGIDASDGLLRLQIKAGKNATAGAHTVVVSDATNQQVKWLIIRIP
jgi:hypothetical protein